MFSNFKKAMLLVMVTMALASCDSSKQATKFLQNPQLLNDTLQTCSLGKMQGDVCVNAKLTKEVIDDFTRRATGFFAAQEAFSRLQQRLQADQENQQLQMQVSQQTAELNDQFIRLEEGFGNQIMLAESQLTVLMKRQEQIQSAIQHMAASNVKALDLLNSQKADLASLIQLTRKKIQVMLEFVGISNRVDG